MVDLKHMLATNLRRLRNTRGWTQEELADRAGLSSRYVGAIERAAVSASVSVIGQLAEALGCDPAELVRRRLSR